jgi:Domain of unknown function (DUF1918)
MHATEGDWLVRRSRNIHDRTRRGLILSVSSGGTPPYRVRWADGREALVVPGLDARVTTAADLARADHAEAGRADAA